MICVERRTSGIKGIKVDPSREGSNGSLYANPPHPTNWATWGEPKRLVPWDRSVIHAHQAYPQITEWYEITPLKSERVRMDTAEKAIKAFRRPFFLS